MITKLTIFALVCGATRLIADAGGPSLSDTSAIVERLTISGLLGVAVVVLYGEVKRERKKREENEEANKKFIAEQTKIMTDAAEANRVALGGVADTLISLRRASEEQTEIYKRHIEKLVESATKNGRR
jgi:hypothetical protein